MNKRIVYILLAALSWFSTAITITYAGQLYAGIPQEKVNSVSTETVEPEGISFYEDSPEAAQRKANLARFRMRFLVNRSYDINAILPVWESIAGYIPQHVVHLYTKYETRTATRPAYYTFLFRLSPF
ncbi:MAG: hypothetical protein EOP46_09150 [Sphingobacteriaceae bacterium]|nr:MAG: hypothetical protein EOP46_09150 [Sphingobacteriaceae bacterium]